MPSIAVFCAAPATPLLLHSLATMKTLCRARAVIRLFPVATMVLLLRTLAAGILLSTSALTSAQTLYRPGVSARPYTPQPSQTVLIFEDNYTVVPLGVGEDGMTTYVQQAVQTVVEAIGPDSTFIYPTKASAFAITFVENASGYRYSDPTAGPAAAQTCVFVSGGLASCKGQTTTYVQDLIPIYTIGEPAVTPAPTQTVPNAGDATFLPVRVGLMLGVVGLLQVLHFG
ncbi:hypothetical protein FB45DRAFT_391512 [Roridomyces roridus]|uniref:Uncharacterized protein n=1 Tax=Roridomyces roridus TaxID=1738132 RepID=A0AAD7B1K8_9AGAR|nr:hypothetical protein FB45DRAFT_391512 [Roridomyces roridus]